LQSPDRAQTVAKRAASVDRRNYWQDGADSVSVSVPLRFPALLQLWPLRADDLPPRADLRGVLGVGPRGHGRLPPAHRDVRHPWPQRLRQMARLDRRSLRRQAGDLVQQQQPPRAVRPRRAHCSHPRPGNLVVAEPRGHLHPQRHPLLHRHHRQGRQLVRHPLPRGLRGLQGQVQVELSNDL
ncbi:hypothetical protein PMAYCL1PPCAC_26239, partial [Pristionchus mayeri]